MRSTSTSTSLLHLTCLLVLVACLAVLTLAGWAPGAAAGETALDPVSDTTRIELPIRIDNHTRSDLSCEITLAHCFSRALPLINAGGSGQLRVVFEQNDGTLNVPGPTGELMTIETLWCGFRGNAWQTRSQLALDRSRFEAAEYRHYRCSTHGMRVQCLIASEHH